jgi:CDP-glucose 4,6-dehydratase
MAAQPLVLKSYDDPLYTFEVNVMGTANILNIAFAEKSVRSVVVTTTDKVYKNTGNDLLFSEHDPLEGKDPYSASKVGAESVITAWQHLENFNDSPRVVAVRSGNVIGGGDYSPDRLFPDLVRAYFSEKELIIRNPYSTRPWQHVLDPLYGYLMVLGQSKDKKISKSFNFGPSEKSLSVEHVIKIAEQVCKDKIKLVLDDENILIKERPLKEAKNLDLNSGRARNEIGWTPFWKQEDAVRDTIRWWQNVLEFGMSPNQACQLDLQAFLARKTETKEALWNAAIEEHNHLIWCRERLDELGAHPSHLNGLWYSASFLIGLIAASVGDDWSNGFVVETERQVDAHLGRHLVELPLQDERSRAILIKMQEEEQHHAAAAEKRGGRDLPAWVKQLMSLKSQVMTRTAYWV